MPLHFEGFPSQSDYIELPDMIELLRSPIMLNLDADEAYKLGGDLVRHLLNITPLKNNQKRIIVTSQVQYLTPEFCPVRSEFKPSRDWHVDATGFKSRDVAYLMLTETEANTEFNANPVMLEQFNEDSFQGEVIRYMNDNDIGLVPQKMEGNRITTFWDRHIHRAGQATKPTLRYMWRVVESDHLKPLEINDFSFGTSYVYKYKIPFPSIKQTGDGIIIY
jgi:hypothetical protein